MPSRRSMMIGIEQARGCLDLSRSNGGAAMIINRKLLYHAMR